MTDDRVALLELIEKGSDANLVRELLSVFAEGPLPSYHPEPRQLWLRGAGGGRGRFTLRRARLP